jgi:hypothetical protein
VRPKPTLKGVVYVPGGEIFKEKGASNLDFPWLKYQDITLRGMIEPINAAEKSQKLEFWARRPKKGATVWADLLTSKNARAFVSGEKRHIIRTKGEYHLQA